MNSSCGGNGTRPCASDADCASLGTCCAGGKCCGSAVSCTDDSDCSHLTTCVIEACDDGNGNDCDGCTHDCAPITGCGDGVICGLETCDDGNTTAHDTCSADCCAEVPGPNGMPRLQKFDSMHCFRASITGEVNALTEIPAPLRRRFASRLDRAGALESRAKALLPGDPRGCTLLRRAIAITQSLKRRLEGAAARYHVPPAELAAIEDKITALDQWYATCP